MPKVLIVEDEVAIARLIEFGLKQAGFLVQMAESAEDAKMLINECLPDVVLLDWILPKMSGWNCYKYLGKINAPKICRLFC